MHSPLHDPKRSSVAVLGLDIVGKGLGLLELGAVVIVVIVVILRSNVIHLVDATTLGASLDGAIARKLDKAERSAFSCSTWLVHVACTYTKPVHTVSVDRVSGAAGKLLVAGGADQDGVFHGSQAGGVKRAHVEDVDALHLAENFQTLQTGGLLEVGGNGTGGGARAKEILLGPDLCSAKSRQLLRPMSAGRDTGNEMLFRGGGAVPPLRVL